MDYSFKILIDTYEASKGLAQDISKFLRTRGINVTGVTSLQKVLAKADNETVIFISLLEIHKPFVRHLSRSDLSGLQYLFNSAKGLIWLSRGGADAAAPDYAIVDGLTRTIRLENPRFGLVHLALDLQEQMNSRQLLWLSKIVQQINFGLSSSDLLDVCYRESNGMLLIGRLKFDTALDSTFQTLNGSVEEEISELDKNLFLKFSSDNHNSLVKFHSYEESLLAPNLHCTTLDICIRAYDVSGRDASGFDENTIRGCAGEVIGSTDTCGEFQAGDRVCAIISSGITTPVRAAQHCCARVPDSLSFADAALIPRSYLLAHLAFQAACVSNYDRVFIEDAASVCGQAAIQMAKIIGVKEIQASAASIEERNLLIRRYGMDPACIYPKEIWLSGSSLQTASLPGMDVFICTLPNSDPKAWLKCILPFGRIVDIAERKPNETSIPFSVSSQAVSFLPVRLSTWMENRPEKLQAILKNVIQSFESKQLVPISEITTYSLSNIDQAIKSLNQGSNSRRIVVETRLDRPLMVN